MRCKNLTEAITCVGVGLCLSVHTRLHVNVLCLFVYLCAQSFGFTCQTRAQTEVAFSFQDKSHKANGYDYSEGDTQRTDPSCASDPMCHNSFYHRNASTNVSPRVL